MASYERLDIIEFGKQLIATEDLDPVYCALWRGNLSRLQKCQFILGWMQYYHCGLACWMMEQQEMPFIDSILYVAKHGKTYGMRGSQRVHHRGPPAIASAQDLMAKFNGAAHFINQVEKHGPTLRKMFEYLLTIVGWGPCFAWRVPDLMDRLALAKVKALDDDTDLFFSNPKRGAILCAETYGLDMRDPCRSAHDYVMQGLRHLKAPPRYERPIGIFETETVFCKWKSHMVGRYAVGRDTARACNQFQHEKFKDIELCQLLHEYMPKVAHA